jgi:hypothetical protein
LFDHAKDLFVEANDGPLAPLRCWWLTNRRNIPTAINSATRVPTINEATQCRGSMGIGPAPFCAAPMPNQKRRLPIAWLPSSIPRWRKVRAPDGFDQQRPGHSPARGVLSSELSPSVRWHSPCARPGCRHRRSTKDRQDWTIFDDGKPPINNAGGNLVICRPRCPPNQW